jgi:hypothetical protein
MGGNVESRPLKDSQGHRQAKVVDMDVLDKDSVVHVKGPSMKGHGCFLEVKLDYLFACNFHICEIDKGEKGPIELTTLTGKFNVIFDCIYRDGDFCIGHINSLKGKLMSPLVRSLKVSFTPERIGACTVHLLGCNICGAQTAYDFIQLNSGEYRINTIDGDCGRPVLWLNKFGGYTTHLYLLGLHCWGNVSKFTNGFDRIYTGPHRQGLVRVSEGSVLEFDPTIPSKYSQFIEYIGQLPTSSSPSSAFIPDPLGESYLSDMVDHTIYEIKKINQQIATDGLKKYDNDDFKFSNTEAYNMALHIAEMLMQSFLKDLSLNPESAEELGNLGSRTGGGAINKTSAGTPYNRYYDNKVELIAEHADEIWDAIHSGDIMKIIVIFSSFLKDEVRAKAKDPRSILSAPIHHTMVCVYLFYYAHHNSTYKASDVNFPSALGIDVLKDLEKLWTEMFAATGEGGSYDVDAMDTTCSASVMEDIFAIWRRYIPEKNLKLFDWAVGHAIYSYMKGADGSIWRKFGGNPTGWFCTSDLNTWISLVYFLYVFCCWSLEHHRAAITKAPFSFLKSKCRNKHNGDDTFFAWLQKNFQIPKSYFNKCLGPHVKLTWDDPKNEVSKDRDVTFLSMKPVELGRHQFLEKLKYGLTHCKVERPLMKMLYKKSNHGVEVFFSKITSLMGLVLFDKPLYDKLYSVRERYCESYGAPYEYDTAHFKELRGVPYLEWSERIINKVSSLLLKSQLGRPTKNLLEEMSGNNNNNQPPRQRQGKKNKNKSKKLPNGYSSNQMAQLERQIARLTSQVASQSNRKKNPSARQRKIKTNVASKSNMPEVIRSRNGTTRSPNADNRLTISSPTLSVSKYAAVTCAFNNLFKDTLDTTSLAPVNTTNRRMAMARMPAMDLVATNGFNTTGMYPYLSFSKSVILNGNMQSPIWTGSYLVDGEILVHNTSPSTQMFDPIYSARITVPSGSTNTNLFGLIVRNDCTCATISRYNTHFNHHAWAFVFTGVAASMKQKKKLRRLSKKFLKEVNSNLDVERITINDNGDVILKPQDSDYIDDDVDTTEAVTGWNFTYGLMGDPTIILELSFYDAGYVLQGQGNVSVGSPLVFNYTTSDMFAGYLLIKVVAAPNNPVDVLLIATDGTTMTLVSSTNFGEYNTQDPFGINFAGFPSILEPVLSLSDECRLVRILSVFTDVDSVNALNGSVTQAYIYGETEFLSSWQQLLNTSPTLRIGPLMKGFDMFWVAQEREYTWSNSWLANPFQDPSCTPSVSSISANYNTNSMQLQQKHFLWAEYLTQNPALVTQFVLDHSQEWFTLVSALMQSFRYSANFDHKKVLLGVSTMAKWLVGGSTEAVALRKALLTSAKFAGSAISDLSSQYR